MNGIMLSPADATSTLELVELEPDLLVYRCPSTGGHWIPAANYWRWLAHQPERLPRLGEEQGKNVEETGENPVRICPETGVLMTRFRVGHGFDFSVDRSITGGVWLDSGEWEALKSRQFHDELHLIFTAPWQQRIREERLTETLRESFRGRLGDEVFQRVGEFKTWLRAQEGGKQQDILTFLQDEAL